MLKAVAFSSQVNPSVPDEHQTSRMIQRKLLLEQTTTIILQQQTHGMVHLKPL